MFIVNIGHIHKQNSRIGKDQVQSLPFHKRIVMSERYVNLLAIFILSQTVSVYSTISLLI